MRASLLSNTAALCLLSTAGASYLSSTNTQPRGLPNAPNGYAPANVTCPSVRPTIRSAATLSPNETAWLKTRRTKTTSAMLDFFDRIDIDGFDAVSYIKDNADNTSSLPTIAIGISGGGLVACLNGGGAIKAFDNRTDGATGKGQLGGLLQSATYFSALSGGSWALGSIYVNNFTTVSNLQENLWNFESPEIVLGPSDMSYTDFWGNITAQVKSKRDAGFITGDADFWGRIQGYNFFNATDGGVDYTWSSIAQTSSFQDGDMPLPLVVMTGNSAATESSEAMPSDPIYETTPWEWGTYDDNIYGFVPLEYLGTHFINGIVPDNEACVRGFDNAGFITGSSSDIWNENGVDIVAELKQGIAALNSSDPTNAEIELLEFIIEEFLSATSSTNSTDNGPASYDPNPFYGYNADTSPFATTERLIVEDGGENSQNVPLYPLIQKKRNVDVIFAVDSLGVDDFDSDWPTGAPLIATYNRTLLGIANDTTFPPVPDRNTFLNLGLNTGPTFFGCNASTLSSPLPPLVVYLPNHPVSFKSNYSLTQGNFTNANRDAVIENGYNVATQGNGTLDADWTTCVGCAILSRSLDRTGTAPPDACVQCFERYCWNGTVDDNTPAPYTPSVELNGTSTAQATGSSTVSTTSSAGVLRASSLLSAVGLMMAVITEF
ncbi:Lysophospholipase 1 [Sporothrix eucalyptigena]|uniref:Lysophospholipase n=1 Tax=Sporothrix eucalyptigena TaxID=1812306 RepID=A0ABP0C2A9_9PEZI